MSDMYALTDNDIYEYECEPDHSCPRETANFLLGLGWRCHNYRRTEWRNKKYALGPFTWDQAVAIESARFLSMGNHVG